MTGILLALPLSVVQATPYSGTWTAEKSGVTFIRLEMTTANGAPQGRLGLGDVHLDHDGVVETATAVPDLLPLRDIVVRGSTIAFTRDNDGDPEDFELHLLPDGGELVFLPSAEILQELKDNDLPLPKPMRVTRRR